MLVNGNKYRRKKGNQAGSITVQSGDTLTVASGGTLTVASGATMTQTGGTLTTPTLTTPTINGGTVDQAAVEDLSELVVTTNVITAAETGKTFYLDLAGGFASTLPAAAIGLNYKFIIKTAPTTAYTIAAAGAIIHGVHLPADGTAGVAINGVTTLTLVANTAIKGDRVEVESDGTSWYAVIMTEDTDHLTVA